MSNHPFVRASLGRQETQGNILGLAAEVKTFDLWVFEQGPSGPLEAVPSQLQDVAAVGYGQRPRGVLLHYHQREARALHLHELVEDERDEFGREPQRRL